MHFVKSGALFFLSIYGFTSTSTTIEMVHRSSCQKGELICIFFENLNNFFFFHSLKVTGMLDSVKVTFSGGGS